jgi:hypothetical protein
MKKKLIILFAICLLALAPVKNIYAHPGGLRGVSIKTCGGITYGQHSQGDGAHWHVAVPTSNDRWIASGDPIFIDPCPSSSTNTSPNNSTSNQDSNSNSNNRPSDNNSTNSTTNSNNNNQDSSTDNNTELPVENENDNSLEQETGTQEEQAEEEAEEAGGTLGAIIALGMLGGAGFGIYKIVDKAKTKKTKK